MLQQIVEKYDDVDLNGVTIDANRIPEILSSLVKHYKTEELETLIQAVDTEGKRNRHTTHVYNYYVATKFFVSINQSSP